VLYFLIEFFRVLPDLKNSKKIGIYYARTIQFFKEQSKTYPRKSPKNWALSWICLMSNRKINLLTPVGEIRINYHNILHFSRNKKVVKGLARNFKPARFASRSETRRARKFRPPNLDPAPTAQEFKTQSAKRKITV